MKIIEPYFEIKENIDPGEFLRKIEAAGRVCYKSEDKIAEGTAEKFIAALIKRGHESVLEHEKITALLICDRGVTHEIVRHRIASYSQESTRYCNYTGEKFGNELTFIRPFFWEENGELYKLWIDQMRSVEDTYFKLIKSGASAQEARSILPNSLKTEIVVTMNVREWRHFFKLRASAASHPQMRQIAIMVLKKYQEILPELFGDITYKNV
jgi:thymidylate synthase (FAD)